MDRFAGAGRVLDLGCGRGIFLDLLREAGVAAVGIDASEAAVAACRERGHDARRADAVAALDDFAKRGETFGGIFASHVVEHLPPERVPALFAGLAAALAPGGRAVVVTPDPANLVVLTEVFWLDPTHVRPWPRPVLEAFGRAAGLNVVASYGDPATAPRRPPLRRLLARIRSALSGADRSGPMDSVMVFGRP